MKYPAIFTNRFSALLCLILAVSVLAVPTALFLLPKETFLQEENRMAATLPTPSAESVLDGKYTDGLAQYLRDHLPLRSTLLKTKAAAEYTALKQENNHVIAAKDGYLIKRFSYSEQQLATFDENIAAIRALAAALETYQKPVTFVCAPRAVDVLDCLCPPWLSEPNSVWEHKALQGVSAKLRQLLRQKAAEGEPVWFHTDHHWTPLGAYYAYAVLGDTLGYTPHALSDFYGVTVCDDFFGTSYSASLAPFCTPDLITAMRYEDDERFVCTDMTTGKRENGFYREDALSTNAKYEYFLGRNVAHLRITEDSDKTRPTLLVIKDSYAQSLTPFLARHFDVELIDLRYFRTDATDTLRQIVQSPHYAGTLILCNADTLTADVGFARIDAEKLQ